MAKYTRLAIMNTFMDQLQYKSLDKITVKDIIENAEINRNTFYYYFNDIYDLIDQIFKEELDRFLSESDEDCSFYDEYLKAASIILNHKTAIVHIYHSKSKEILNIYIEKTCNAFIGRFVRKDAEPFHLSEEGIDYITYFYSSAITAHTLRWIEQGMQSYRDEFIKIMSTSYEATVHDMIRNYLNFDQS